MKKSDIQGKLLLPELMQNEFQILEETAHPHIMRIFELLEDSQNFYIVSELIKGKELYDWIAKLRKFSEINAA